MNDAISDVKKRLRTAEDLLRRSGSSSDNVRLAQAIDRTRRLLRHADRGREPTPELLHAMQAVDALTSG
ncbi:hypothetical protein [Anaeromyxobacter oryzae]|uniref:Uncharacterized protein n=1 Tax=Anaeromyxobacter oryzae TaxID=2918170 RepID=A0ABN6MPR5_9BACT|nr:hypothetical protein [Anaeromyxobacter oryzae]BDG02996.1 hypothetical protein AMOR_19920 [Anaeromyxobacter oryzae]